MTLSGCEERTELDMCRMRRPGSVTKVEGPSTGQVNQDIAITAYVMLAGNCSGVERFVETTSSNTQTIRVNTYTDTCVACTNNYIESPTVYTFKTNKPGTYYLKFASFNDQYITDTLVVR